jgi:dCTP deaminase
MILSDREIKAAARTVISISPFPAEQAWSSTAVDLRLAHELVIWKNPSGRGAQVSISPSHPDFDFLGLTRDFGERVKIADDGFLFRSRSFFLGWTIEKLKLPFRSRLAARVEGKSSLARLGIGVHVTAPTIHAGFGDKPRDESYAGSPLQLEIWNVGPLDILLQTGMPIC